MIISTLAAAALASTSPAQAAPAPAHSHSSMAGEKKAEGKMDCCKDGCECCAKKEAAATPKAAPAR